MGCSVINPPAKKDVCMVPALCPGNASVNQGGRVKTVMSAPPCQGAMKNMAIVTNPWSASASLDGLGSSALSPFVGLGATRTTDGVRYQTTAGAERDGLVRIVTSVSNTQVARTELANSPGSATVPLVILACSVMSATRASHLSSQPPVMDF